MSDTTVVTMTELTEIELDAVAGGQISASDLSALTDLASSINPTGGTQVFTSLISSLGNAIPPGVI